MSSKKTTTSILRRLLRWPLRLGSLCLIAVGLFVTAGHVLGRVPANRLFSSQRDGVEIAVSHNGIHSDLILPLKNSMKDWETFLRIEDLTSLDTSLQHVAIGWGNRQFYLETPRWEDVRVFNTLKAFAGVGETAVHVDLVWAIPGGENVRRFKITEEQYKTLCSEIEKSFRIEEKRAVRIPNQSYGSRDAFYEGMGRYHLLRTCNVWTGDILRHTGVRVGWWTPFPSSLFASLPEEEAVPLEN